MNLSNEFLHQIKIGIYPVNKQGETVDDENLTETPEDLLGSRIDFIVRIHNARNLPENLANDTFVKFFTYNEDEPTITPVISGHNQNPEYNFSKHFKQEPVTEAFLQYLEDECIIFEIFGRDSLAENAHAKREKKEKHKKGDVNEFMGDETKNEPEKIGEKTKQMIGSGQISGFENGTNMMDIHKESDKMSENEISQKKKKEANKSNEEKSTNQQKEKESSLKDGSESDDQRLIDNNIEPKKKEDAYVEEHEVDTKNTITANKKKKNFRPSSNSCCPVQ